MANSSEMWSESSSSRGADGWKARRGWMVHGTSNESEAYTAPPLPGHPPIPQIGESHPFNASMKVRHLDADRIGPMTFVVRAHYEIPLQGDFVDPENPLNRPPEISIEWDVSSEPFDVDVDGVPVVNTAGFPFDSDPHFEHFDLSVTIIRNEPFYPLAKSILFRGKVNSGSYTIPNVGTIGDGQALCMPMRSLQSYFPNSTYTPVAYTLKIREDGWRTRIKSQGFMGTVGDEKGRFCNKDGNLIDEPVLLGANGMPLDDKIKILIGKTPTDPVPPPELHVPLTYIEEGQRCRYIRFKRYKAIDFSGLL